MKTTPVRVAAALAAPLLALAACSSGSAPDSGGASDARAASSDAGGPRDLLSQSSAEAASADDAAAQDASKSGAEPVEQPSIISTGSVSLTARDVAAARAAVQHVADTYAGQVTDQETTTSDDKRLGYARMVLRVPARSFARAMADLEKVADLVDSSTTSEDVSTQVIDTEERVKAARASIERIRSLLTRAEKIGDVMAIESQLASREADLNSLLRRQAHLADQTSLATISVSIDRVGAAHARQATDHTGFLAGLRSGWGALRGFAVGAATVAGAVLPWVPVVLLVGVPVWLLVRRARRTSAPATPATAAPATSGEG
jgi:hypothetical protein